MRGLRRGGVFPSSTSGRSAKNHRAPHWNAEQTYRRYGRLAGGCHSSTTRSNKAPSTSRYKLDHRPARALYERATGRGTIRPDAHHGRKRGIASCDGARPHALSSNTEPRIGAHGRTTADVGPTPAWAMRLVDAHGTWKFCCGAVGTDSGWRRSDCQTFQGVRVTAQLRKNICVTGDHLRGLRVRGQPRGSDAATAASQVGGRAWRREYGYGFASKRGQVVAFRKLPNAGARTARQLAITISVLSRASDGPRVLDVRPATAVCSLRRARFFGSTRARNGPPATLWAMAPGRRTGGVVLVVRAADGGVLLRRREILGLPPADP